MSVVSPLPNRPNLANLRKQAKSLLAAWQAGDQQALTRVREWHPRGDRLLAGGRSTLADAQLVVARGHGFASWARLVQYLRLTPQAQALRAMDVDFRPTRAQGAVGPILERRVDLLWRALNDGRPGAAVLLRAVGETRAREELTLDDFRAATARDHGFADWNAVTLHRDELVDPRFESAVDAVVAGDVDGLRGLLAAHPDLARARSPFGHHATLVHYVAVNGVEASRQWQSPGNAVAVLRILLDSGADPDAPCDAYGGGLTPLCGLVSSAHPAACGTQAGLVEELCRGGANPNGPDEDGLPLWTALTYGYVDAVDALARSGARVDNIVFAAAVGDRDKVNDYLLHPLANRPRSAERVGARGPLLDPNHLIEYALVYAAGLGRRAVVELLLATGPDLTVTGPVFHGTAAGMARYHHRDDVLALLEPR